MSVIDDDDNHEDEDEEKEDDDDHGDGDGILHSIPSLPPGGFQSSHPVSSFISLRQ